MKPLCAGLLLCAFAACNPSQQKPKDSISGIYPRLAYYNDEGECGTGAVVPWADRLWVITYGPHLPFGSSDKLYEITPDYRQIVRSESIGGTPANRMIHRESNQLFIGPYAIDSAGRVRVIPCSVMPGRLTGNARHLTEPADKLYYATMEEGFYEVDVNTLAVKELYKDGNLQEKTTEGYAPTGNLLPGVHGKGVYSGQGVLVFSNNGEGTDEALKRPDIQAGVLAEWDGTDWTVIRRNQFTEVTGPGGIEGNPHPEADPIWATGWDHKSVLLGVRDAEEGWSFYRLPKASHSYDGAHGWNTEWPRIRNVGTAQAPEYMMTMHGMFWHFPATFSVDCTAGVRPRSSYLKVIGDFCRWGDRLVFGCDDSAQKEFLNKRKTKGNLVGPGQSNSNLWFTSPSLPDELGPTTADGAVWEKERVKAGGCSDPYLFAGWEERCCWLQNDGLQGVDFTFEVDVKGDGMWETLTTVTAAPGQAVYVPFDADDQGEWIRVKADKEGVFSASFVYTGVDNRPAAPDALFAGLSDVQDASSLGGLVYGLGEGRHAMGLLSFTLGENGEMIENGYYEMGDSLALVRREDDATADFIREKVAIPHQVVTTEASSVLIVDDQNRRWRLPLGADEYTGLMEQDVLRICREVVTERDLFNCHGTFYELPAENADGYAKIRPIASHRFRIHDYASYRGMLVMTGVDVAQGRDNEHIIVSDDGKAAVWVGTIDDLWRMGKPTGQGGPWQETMVKAGEKSDPYLIGFYDKKTLFLSHSADKAVTFSVEIDPTGNGKWQEYARLTVQPGERLEYAFAKPFQARWIRFCADTDTKATAWLAYE